MSLCNIWCGLVVITFPLRTQTVKWHKENYEELGEEEEEDGFGM